MSHHQPLRETQQFFKYVAVTDNRTCKHCLRYDMSLMTRREIEATFKHLYKYNNEFWLPRTHMDLWNRDTCRCGLLLNEVSPESIIQDILKSPIEGLTPFQLQMHNLALSSIVEVRKILVKQENLKNYADIQRINLMPCCGDAIVAWLESKRHHTQIDFPLFSPPVRSYDSTTKHLSH